MTTRALLFQMVRYYAVAGLVALAYLGLLSVALLGPWHYLVSVLIAQAVTISFAFPVYRTLVFRSSGPLGRDFVRFITVWTGGLIAGFLGTPLLVELGGLTPLVAQVIAIVVVSAATFALHRLFSFRTRAAPDPEEAP